MIPDGSSFNVLEIFLFVVILDKTTCEDARTYMYGPVFSFHSFFFFLIHFFFSLFYSLPFSSLLFSSFFRHILKIRLQNRCIRYECSTGTTIIHDLQIHLQRNSRYLSPKEKPCNY